MPNRILKDSIRMSEQIDSLSPHAETLFYRLLTVVDDYGRYFSDVKLVKSMAFPMKEYKANDVEKWFNELEKSDLIQSYTVDGRGYFCFKTWAKHQSIRNQKSKYPEPPTIEINCNQLQSNVHVIQSNPIQSESNAENEIDFSLFLSESEKEALKTIEHPIQSKKVKPDLNQAEAIYNAYPRKVGKAKAIESIQKVLSHCLTPKGKADIREFLVNENVPDERIEPYLSEPYKFVLKRTEAFAKSWEEAPKKMQEFCPHPSTFYNQLRIFDVTYPKQEDK